MRFIHSADLHIDSPMRGLQLSDGAPVDVLRSATRRAVQNLVQFALDRQAAFVVVAGDVFDGKWDNVETGLWTMEQFRRLGRAGIGVFLIRGNHDAASKLKSYVKWPENVHEFSVRHPETVVLEELGVAIHGQGYRKPAVCEDLAASYPDSVPGMFNLGILHTSLTGNPNHEPYAATQLPVLKSRGYDYWALGHIHQRSEPPICEAPYVAFSGNTQGRHIRETGGKGVLLVEVEDREMRSVQFHPTDVLRWHHVRVGLGADDDVDELFQLTEQEFSQIARQAGGRWSAVRVTISGGCAAHRALTDSRQRADVLAQIRNQSQDVADQFWLEDVVVRTGPAVDLEAVRESRDLLGQLLRGCRAAEDADELRSYFHSLGPLCDRYAHDLSDAGIDIEDSQQLTDWLRQAERILMGELLENGS